jgi:hypothetical protein
MRTPKSFLVTYSVILLAQFLTMANSIMCWDDRTNQEGRCTYATTCRRLKGVVGTDHVRCPVSFPFSMIEANLFKDRSCCYGRIWPRLNDCESYFGTSCGEYEGYGQIYSSCCLNSDDTTSVLFCATSGISLTWQQCQSGFSCVEHLGIITSGKKRELAPYAQCEKTED